jgi:hypothetical protein
MTYGVTRYFRILLEPAGSREHPNPLTIPLRAGRETGIELWIV